VVGRVGASRRKGTEPQGMTGSENDCKQGA